MPWMCMESVFCIYMASRSQVQVARHASRTSKHTEPCCGSLFSFFRDKLSVVKDDSEFLIGLVCVVLGIQPEYRVC